MSHPSGRINGSDIVASGNILAGYNDAIEIFPFSNEGYVVKVEIQIDQEDPTARAIGIPGEVFTLKVMRGWFGGSPSVTVDTLVANSATEDFYMNTKVGLIGSIDRFATDLTYVILRKPRA